MSRPDWNERYVTGTLPWDTGFADEHLVEYIESGKIKAGKAFEVGCGTGTNSLWLASRGFSVLGVDVSEEAIAQAKAKKKDSSLSTEFAVMDFLADDVPGSDFDFVFDRGCLHSFDQDSERLRFAEQLSRLLKSCQKYRSLYI